ncbi:MAG TPA: TolC family protein [Thermoanaerobaculia bacterium]|nr:TolC family protein [Thermoanaerobaculia bacterium]
MKRFVISLLMVAATTLQADPLRLTMQEAVDMALGTGTQADLARSAERRADIARSEAFSALLPQADARFQRYSQSINLATFGFTIPGQPSVVGPFPVIDGQLSATVQLFNLAALQRYRALQRASDASRYESRQAENDVAAAVARLYVLAQRSDAQISAHTGDVALFEKLAQVSQDEFQAGTGTRLDVAQANLQLARTRQALLVAQNDRQTILLALLNAIGAAEDADVVLVDPLPAPAVAPATSEALESARKNRPELLAIAAHEQEARLTLQAARARRLPTVKMDFEGDYSGNHQDDLHWTRRIAGTVSLPLFRGDIPANIARAQLQLHDVETSRTQKERDIEQDVRRSILVLENTRSRVSVATTGAQVADEALTIARERRGAGYGSSVEVDRAQDAYRQAHEDLVAAEADAAIAGVELQHATGEIRTRSAAAK